MGIENGTVNYYIDDNMVSTEKTDGNGDFFDIKYDAQGEDDTLQIKKVKFSKLRKFLKKIFKAIAKPFKALARYIKNFLASNFFVPAKQTRTFKINFHMKFFTWS